jgi:hypothetical protein
MDHMTGGKSIRATYYYSFSNWEKGPIFDPTITNKESSFVKRNMYKMPHKEIAFKLKRSVKAIEEYISFVKDLRRAAGVKGVVT